ncbi:MAG: Uma2 family endonuclease [Chthoniobacteraceae bacterium]
MTALRKTDEIFTAEEYLAFELEARRRHEFVGGHIYAMAGTTVVHADICGNIYAALHAQLRGKPCRPFTTEIKLKVRALSDENFYYPDVMVACDPADNAELWRERPSVVFEVLSPSSMRTDFDKFFVYQHIPTLQVYAVVAQTHRLVTLFVRTAEGWKRSTLSDPAASLPLDSIGCQLSLAQIYEGIDFAAAQLARKIND